MKKKYDEIEEQPMMASEPLAEYGVIKPIMRKMCGHNAYATNTETMSIEEACEMTQAAVREEYAKL